MSTLHSKLIQIVSRLAPSGLDVDTFSVATGLRVNEIVRACHVSTPGFKCPCEHSLCMET